MVLYIMLINDLENIKPDQNGAFTFLSTVKKQKSKSFVILFKGFSVL